MTKKKKRQTKRKRKEATESNKNEGGGRTTNPPTSQLRSTSRGHAKGNFAAKRRRKEEIGTQDGGGEVKLEAKQYSDPSLNQRGERDRP